MKTHIIIHVLPFEIDRFEHQMFELHKNSKYLDKTDEVIIDATLNINNSLTNWTESKIPREFFMDRFSRVKSINENWAQQFFDVNDDSKCLGVDDKRRQAIRKYSDVCNNFVYLDNDVFYPNTTLKYMMDAAKAIKSKYYILSPQSTKLWDASWDILVNESYHHLKYDDLYCTDQFEVFTKDYGDITLIPIETFKMGGGWFNMISSNLLAYTDIPESFGPYGLDDTFVIDACKIMKEYNIDVQQYILRNLVVTQSYMHELHDIYLKYLRFDSSKKQRFVETASKFYKVEIDKFIEKCKNDNIHNSNKK